MYDHILYQLLYKNKRFQKIILLNFKKKNPFSKKTRFFAGGIRLQG
ncbi:hypothetical protein CHCC14820_0734 [Bacillus paralicheniformis]|uniref:Uncharacterized protein n=1 Tax=Bacillus paralicheniformis TaxID=1648923 RepID=A0A6I7TRN7_9BACI|nr:hypothetical protein LI7559_12705 [Bacillus licheniformis LMG 7559]KUL18742.1 hypothetical protein LI6934_04750 [Bacillus licheniformis LMG 6934]OLF93728.1 hypothetical protein B4121_2098 [Bacillus paralicheniformis]OLF99551.1 hypothetical protein B4123_4790 [Bacillus paralicheniformis]TWJ36422.1 hypothetical protein CHCC5027_1163 [Bacillus paralicheniformis]